MSAVNRGIVHTNTPPLVGSRLGIYEINERIGIGGMGEVYRARDTRLDRDVAIKILPEVARKTGLARFEREARVLASLNHPNIASIYGFEQSPGEGKESRCGLVLELVEGDTLAERIARGNLAVAETLAIASQILDALDAAHAKGIVHRALKPANIKITPAGVVKVLDFGLAKAVTPDSAKSARATASLTVAATAYRIVLGTPAYMSPEQARGTVVDVRTDIWAFGCVLYEMLAGKRAFPGDGPADTIANVVNIDPDWRALPKEVPRRVRLTVRACLQKDCKQRLPDAQSVRHALEGQRLRRRTTSAPQEARHLRSVVVLPVRATLKSEGQEAFARGVHEGLIAALTRVRPLRVISRTSSEHLATDASSIANLVKQLQVDVIVAVDVIEFANDVLEFAVELVDSITQRRLWSDRVTSSRSQILNVQTRVAATVAQRLGIRCALPTEVTKHRVNGAAHRAYLKGLFLYENRVGDWLKSSFTAFSEAVREDHRFAPAHVALSRWYVMASRRAIGSPTANIFSQDWREALTRAESAARAALKLNPHLASGHSALARVLSMRWRFVEAMDAYARAIALDPNDVQTRMSYSAFLNVIGRPKEAIKEARLALTRDPFATSAYEALALAYYSARRFDDCIHTCHRGLDMAPNATLLLVARGLAESLTHRHDAARATMAAASKTMPNHPSVLSAVAVVSARAGRKRDALAQLGQLRSQGAAAVSVAEVLVAVGSLQPALDALEEAFEEGRPDLVSIRSDPLFEPLHGHPRFRRLVKGVGLAGSDGVASGDRAVGKQPTTRSTSRPPTP